MPTGYTAKLMEKGQTFPEFVMLCARAMGACITMRDDSFDAPIPEKFEPDDYHLTALKKAERELTRLQKMSNAERKALGAEKQAADIKAYEQIVETYQQEDARLNEMIAQVTAWEPPTKDHEGLRKFMLEQLEISLHGKYDGSSSLRDARSRGPLWYYTRALETAEHDVGYHKKALKEEAERAAKRTAWVKQLRESLSNELCAK